MKKIKVSKEQSLLFTAGMCLWGLFMPPSGLGLILALSAGVLIIKLTKDSARKTIKPGAAAICMEAVILGGLVFIFLERWILSGKISAIADKLHIKPEYLILLVAVLLALGSVPILTKMLSAPCCVITARRSCIPEKSGGLDWKDIAFAAAVAVVIGFEFATSPFSDGYPGTDSSAFIYIGERMRDGLVPYVDLFDHKGILLYFIQYVGCVIGGGGFSGIWLLELCNLFATALFMIKAVRLFLESRIAAYLASALVFLAFLSYFSTEGGNVVEEYALPWLVMAVYIVLKYFLTDTYSVRGIVGLGIGFAVVFFLRANMITAWIAYLPVIFVSMIYRKKYRDLLKCALAFCIGCMVVCLPLLFYFLATDSMNAMLECYIRFNFGYSDSEGTLLGIGKTAVYLIALSPVVFALIAVSVRNIAKDRIFLLNGWYLFVTVFLASMSGRNYQHYGIIFVPALIVPAVSCVSRWGEIEAEGKNDSVFGGVLALVTVLTVAVGMAGYNGGAALTQASEYLAEHTEETDDVLALGNNCRYYLESGRSTENKFFYQTPPINVSDELYAEFLDDLMAEQPECILVPGERGGTAEDNDNYGKLLLELAEWERNGLYSCQEYDTFYVYVKN